MEASAIQFSFTQRAAALVKQNQIVSGSVAVPPASVLPGVGDSISLLGAGGNSYGFTVVDRMFHFAGNQARLVILLDVLRQNSPFAARPAQQAAPAPDQAPAQAPAETPEPTTADTSEQAAAATPEPADAGSEAAESTPAAVEAEAADEKPAPKKPRRRKKAATSDTTEQSE
jgi:hypothetical protein